MNFTSRAFLSVVVLQASLWPGVVIIRSYLARRGRTDWIQTRQSSDNITCNPEKKSEPSLSESTTCNTMDSQEIISTAVGASIDLIHFERIYKHFLFQLNAGASSGMRSNNKKEKRLQRKVTFMQRP